MLSPRCGILSRDGFLTDLTRTRWPCLVLRCRRATRWALSSWPFGLGLVGVMLSGVVELTLASWLGFTLMIVPLLLRVLGPFTIGFIIGVRGRHPLAWLRIVLRLLLLRPLLLGGLPCVVFCLRLWRMMWNCLALAAWSLAEVFFLKRPVGSMLVSVSWCCWRALGCPSSVTWELVASLLSPRLLIPLWCTQVGLSPWKIKWNQGGPGYWPPKCKNEIRGVQPHTLRKEKIMKITSHPTEGFAKIKSRGSRNKIKKVPSQHPKCSRNKTEGVQGQPMCLWNQLKNAHLPFLAAPARYVFGFPSFPITSYNKYCGGSQSIVFFLFVACLFWLHPFLPKQCCLRLDCACSTFDPVYSPVELRPCWQPPAAVGCCLVASQHIVRDAWRAWCLQRHNASSRRDAALDCFGDTGYFRSIDWEATRKFAASCPQARTICTGGCNSPAALGGRLAGVPLTCVWPGCSQLGTFDHIAWSCPCRPIDLVIPPKPGEFCLLVSDGLSPIIESGCW